MHILEDSPVMRTNGSSSCAFPRLRPLINNKQQWDVLRRLKDSNQLGICFVYSLDNTWLSFIERCSRICGRIPMYPRLQSLKFQDKVDGVLRSKRRLCHFVKSRG